MSLLLVLFAAELLWKATPLTPPHSFTKEIEGPATDRSGNLYAVSYARKPTIGRVKPSGEAEVWLEMPEGSVGNGIRFDWQGWMYVADYTGHNVLRIDPATKKISVFAHNPEMNQPNDLALAPDDSLYASDPNWKDGTGQIWHIDREGKTKKVAEGMGTTNGIDVSPNGKHLYVNESVQRKIWVFDIAKDKSLRKKRLLIEFPDFGFDGMRVDRKGNLYVTRYGKGVVAVVSPRGRVLREVPVLGEKPSNLCFGGEDGKTVFVTEVEHGRVVSFRSDQPGWEYTRNGKRGAKKSLPSQR